MLYVDLIDLYTAVEHYVKVLVGVKADLVLICVQVREAVVDRNIAEALLDEGVEALEGGLLELYYLVLRTEYELNHYYYIPPLTTYTYIPLHLSFLIGQ